MGFRIAAVPDGGTKGLFYMFGAALKCFQVAFAGGDKGYLKISR